tara:strand:+ start:977 stop:1966 length:990 start_codon:yes stop_codon:yes gene_type:complete
MTQRPIWITENEVVELISLPEAIEALERILPLEVSDKAASMPKTHLMVDKNDAMHAIGGAVSGIGYCGFKTWINIQGRSETTLTLFSLENAACLAVIEATALGQMRTAAMTGVGTKRLAPAEADSMAIVGTGKQSLPQIAAVHAVRPLNEVRVWSRNPETRESFAHQVTKSLRIPTYSMDSLDAATKDSPLVTLITNSTKPFLDADILAKNSHLNAMGAIIPARMEFSENIFNRVDLAVVDSLKTVRELSTEFRNHYGKTDDLWKEVTTIASIIKEDRIRPLNADVTLFKAMGMGLSDLALGIEIFDRAKAKNKGTPLPIRKKFSPRLI